MTSFVLVHGAWGGATLWRSFAPLLREKGHEVFFTSLTGLGERYHLGTAETNLSTHIQDVVELIEYENLHDIALVGHSYGGMVITGVADRIPDRIAHLVYLDAFLPNDGPALFDMDGTRGGGRGPAAGPPPPPPPFAPPGQWPATTAPDEAWTPQPRRPLAVTRR